MKYFLIIGLAFLASHSIAQYHFYPENSGKIITNKNTLANLPLVPDDNKNVDVFFNNEDPKQPYYYVRIIEEGKTSSDYNNVLSLLKHKAAAEGFDAIKILGITESMVPGNSVGSAVAQGITGALAGNKSEYENYRTNYIGYQKLSAIGIKYKSRLQYVDTIVKTATIEFPDHQPLYKVDFDFNGYFKDSIQPDANHFYLTNISIFKNADLLLNSFNLLNEKQGTLIPTTGKMDTDSGTVRYDAYFKVDKNREEVLIKLPAGEYDSPRKYKLTYQLNNSRQPVERFISYGRKGKPLYKDVYQYDSNNRCTAITRYDATNGKKIFAVLYDYYNMGDLPKAKIL